MTWKKLSWFDFLTCSKVLNSFTSWATSESKPISQIEMSGVFLPPCSNRVNYQFLLHISFSWAILISHTKFQLPTLCRSLSVSLAPTCSSAKPNKFQLRPGYYCIWFLIWSDMIWSDRTRIAYLAVFTNLEPPNQKSSFIKCFSFGLVSPQPVLNKWSTLSATGGGGFYPYPVLHHIGSWNLAWKLILTILK